MSQKEQTKQKLSQLREEIGFGEEDVEVPVEDTDGSLSTELIETTLEELREVVSEVLEDRGLGELGGALLEGIDVKDLDADQLGSIGETVGRRLGETAGRRVGELLGEWLDDVFEDEDSEESADGEDDEDESDSGDDLDGMSTEDLQGLADDLMDELDERTDS